MLVRILFIVFITHFTQAQTSSDIKETVENYLLAFNDESSDESNYALNISKFLDISTNVDSLSADFASFWFKQRAIGSYPIETTFRNFVTDDSGLISMVQIENIWHMPNNDLYFILTETKWIKISNYWYRSGEPMKTLEKYKMVRE